MTRRHPPPPISWPGRTGPSAVQAFQKFAPVARPKPGGAQGSGDELVGVSDALYALRDQSRNANVPPNGTYNFVRVQGATRNQSTTMVSLRCGHAALAGGRSVIYAGTASFEQGKLQWWSNYSGTYQPIAAFHHQAGLPDDKFVPWQRLQMGGTAMQRGTFQERRAATAPERTKIERPQVSAPATKTEAGASGEKAKPPAPAPASASGNSRAEQKKV